MQVLGNQYIFIHTQVFEETNVLEGAGNAQLRDLAGLFAGDVNFLRDLAGLFAGDVNFLPVCFGIDYPPFGRCVHAGDVVEGRGLARAVRADEGNDFMFFYNNIQIVDGNDAAKLHGHMLGTQYGPDHLPCTPFLRKPLFFPR